MDLRIWPLFTIVNLVLLSGWLLPVQAQSGSPLDAVPRCGVFCLAGSLNVSSCAPFNYNQTCLCGDQTYSDAVELCVLSSCTVKESLITKNATEASCGAVPRDRSQTLYQVVVVLAVLTLVIVTSRLAFRVLVSKTGLYADDWAILATVLVGISGTTFIATGSLPNGLGKELWTLTADQITLFGMWFFATEVQYFVTVSTLKLSLLLFYLRIFPSATVRRLLWATVVFNLLYGLSFFLVTLLQCQPLSYFWTKWDGEHQGHCANINAVGWANAVVSIVLDLWMLAMPLSQLKQLRLHWKKKVGVALMFFVGTFVTVVSIIRLQSLVSFANSINLTYDNWDVNLWSTIEINVGIICACMPTIRQILAWYFPNVFGTGTRPGRYYPNPDTRKGGGGGSAGSHGGHGMRASRKLGGPPLHLHRTESRSALTGRDNTVPNSPTTLHHHHHHHSGTLAASPTAIEPSPALEQPTRGIRVERSFYVDQSSLEEGVASVPLEDLKKGSPHARYLVGGHQV